MRWKYLNLKENIREMWRVQQLLKNAVEVAGRGSSSPGQRCKNNQKVQELLPSLSRGKTGHLLIRGSKLATKNFYGQLQAEWMRKWGSITNGIFGENELHFRSIFPRGFEEGGQMVG